MENFRISVPDVHLPHLLIKCGNDTDHKGHHYSHQNNGVRTLVVKVVSPCIWRCLIVYGFVCDPFKLIRHSRSTITMHVLHKHSRTLVNSAPPRGVVLNYFAVTRNYKRKTTAVKRRINPLLHHECITGARIQQAFWNNTIIYVYKVMMYYSILIMTLHVSLHWHSHSHPLPTLHADGKCFLLSSCWCSSGAVNANKCFPFVLCGLLQVCMSCWFLFIFSIL